MKARDGSKEPARHIPWGYGKTRIAAMPVDPERLYTYWELTDSTLEAARKALAGQGSEGGLVLRVHDVTGRIFDGVNSHGSFDIPVERSDRQWFVTVGRPESSAVVEIGFRTPGGAYLPLARSRRVEFPRREPAPPTAPEWGRVKERVFPDGHPGPAGVERLSAASEGPGSAPGAGNEPSSGPSAPDPARSGDPNAAPPGGGGSESRLESGPGSPRGGASEERLGGRTA